MRLPNAERAIVDAAKVRDYLLSATHPVGRAKARYLGTLGYRAEDWARLAEDLREHARANDAAAGKRSEYGEKYAVTGPLRGPNGGTAQVTVAWIVLRGENDPRLVTAFPARGRR